MSSETAATATADAQQQPQGMRRNGITSELIYLSRLVNTYG